MNAYRKLSMFNRAAQIRSGAINGLGAGFNLNYGSGPSLDAPTNEPGEAFTTNGARAASFQLDYGTGTLPTPTSTSNLQLPELKLDLSWARDIFSKEQQRQAVTDGRVQYRPEVSDKLFGVVPWTAVWLGLGVLAVGATVMAVRSK